MFLLFDFFLHLNKHDHLHQFLLLIYEQGKTNQLQSINHQFYSLTILFRANIFIIEAIISLSIRID